MNCECHCVIVLAGGWGLSVEGNSVGFWGA